MSVRHFICQRGRLSLSLSGFSPDHCVNEQTQSDTEDGNRGREGWKNVPVMERSTDCYAVEKFGRGRGMSCVALEQGND